MSAPPRTNAGLDTRIARSPIVALRFHLDSLAADLSERIAEIERLLIEATAARDTLLRQLRRADETRRGEPANTATLRSWHDALALVDELSRIEERVRHGKRMLDRTLAERELLRTVSARVREVAPPDTVFDADAARLSQAARAVSQLLDDEYAGLAAQILDGPMQRLAESCFEAELAEQSMRRDDETAAAHAARCRERAAAAAAELDGLAWRLQPITAQRGLVDAVRTLLQHTGEGRRITLRVIGTPRRAPRLTEIALYRIVEEAVANAVRHAQPSKVDVVIAFHPARISLMVKDDGEGFDVAAAEASLGRTGGLGLIAMQEQAALVGTKVEVRSLIGAGTEVRAMISDNTR